LQIDNYGVIGVLDGLARQKNLRTLQNSEGPGGVEIWVKIEKIFKKSGSNSKIIASI